MNNRAYSFDEKMEDWIPLINELQSIFRKTEIDEIKLPQIVVVGAQSTGKSSVLESLVGKSFLPRGNDIVTRCPIIIQLNQLVKQEGGGPVEEYCQFSEFPERKFFDFDLVSEAIEEHQIKLAGAEKGISKEPIVLEIYSPNVINLTLMDLPGIVKVARDGQPENIEEQVYNLIKSKIENEYAIILAVSAANADLATSESLKMAKEVDPHGDRTLAVMTKLDLMDEGTDATDMLLGKVIKVKLGIIGVVNRSQQDLNDQTSDNDARKKEQKYLEENYRNFLPRIGSKYLGQRLNELLRDHINKCLPDLVKRVTELTIACEAELHGLGKDLPKDAMGCAWLIMDVTVNFIDKFKNVIWKHGEKMADLKVEDRFPVKLTAIFANFVETISEQCDLDAQKILDRLKGTMNFERFSSIEDAFKDFVKLELKKLKNPAINCAREVHALLQETVPHCFKPNRVEYLNRRIQNIVDDLLNRQLEDTISGIEEQFKREKKMIHTYDEKFTTLVERFNMKENDEAVEQLPQVPIEEAGGGNACIVLPITMDPHTAKLLTWVQQLIATYMRVVKRRLIDDIPRFVMFRLAHQTIKEIPNAVKNAIYGRETSMVFESEADRIKRCQQQDRLTNLHKASSILNKVRMRY